MNGLHGRSTSRDVKRTDNSRDLIRCCRKIFNFYYGSLLDEKKAAVVFNLKFFTNYLNTVRDASIQDKKHIDQIVNLNGRDDLEKKLYAFIYGFWFQLFLTGVICVNSFTLAVQTDRDLRRQHQFWLEMFDYFSNGVYSIEFCLKLVYDPYVYWTNLWNWFDFCLLVMGHVALFTGDEYSKSIAAGRLFRTLRVFIALRSLRTIRVLNKLQIIVNTFFKSIYDCINIVALMVILMIMFSLIGCSFFAAKAGDYFRNLDTGMLTIFYCATREGLTDLFDAVENNRSTDDYNLDVFWKLFLIMLIVIFAFVFTNLIVAIVVSNMQQALKENSTGKEEAALKSADFNPDNLSTDDFTKSKRKLYNYLSLTMSLSEILKYYLMAYLLGL